MPNLSAGKPRVFEKCETAKKELRDIIQDNLVQPRALGGKFAAYSHLLTTDPDEHVNAWFAPIKTETPEAKVGDDEGEGDEADGDDENYDE